MKIVIGYSGSKSANAMLKDLAHAGLPAKAEVMLIHAVPSLLPLESLAPDATGGVTWYADAYQAAVKNHALIVKRAKADSKDAVKLLKGLYPAWKIASETPDDEPAHAILAAAETWKADRIVIGSTGWNAVGKWIGGSVADRVLTHAHCAVRLGKGKAPSGTHAPRLLIAYDGSAYADAAVQHVAAGNWPKGTEARLVAVSEFQLHLGNLAAAVGKALGAKVPESPWPWMDKKLLKAAAILGAAGISAGTAVLIDEPRRGILTQAKKFKADTIVLGTHGLTGMKRFLLGSVSEAVAAHADCAVEIVRIASRKKAGSR